MADPLNVGVRGKPSMLECKVCEHSATKIKEQRANTNATQQYGKEPSSCKEHPNMPAAHTMHEVRELSTTSRACVSTKAHATALPRLS